VDGPISFAVEEPEDRVGGWLATGRTDDHLLTHSLGLGGEAPEDS
jgi:hypothetical protein